MSAAAWIALGAFFVALLPGSMSGPKASQDKKSNDRSSDAGPPIRDGYDYSNDGGGDGDGGD